MAAVELSIAKNHEHALNVIHDYERADMIREVRSKCSVCGIEEKRSFNSDGSPRGVLYRLNGGWLNPVDLLRLALNVELCPDCEGDGCAKCGVGVLEAGGLSRISPPS